MNRFILSLVIATAVAMPSAADNPVSEITILNSDAQFCYIPSEFSADGKAQLYYENNNDDGSCEFVILDRSFQESKTISVDSNDLIRPIYSNPDILSDYDAHLYLSQTLFNSDRNYEYIRPILTQLNGYYITSGFKIVNDEGLTLQTVNVPQDVLEFCSESGNVYDSFDIWNLNGEYFMFLEYMSHSMYDYETRTIVYKINRSDSGSSVAYIRSLESRMTVSPQVARRNFPVTVTLDENVNYSNVQLIDESGRVVMSTSVNGQTSIQIGTSGLRKGVYIVRAVGDTVSQETCKIIIR